MSMTTVGAREQLLAVADRWSVPFTVPQVDDRAHSAAVLILFGVLDSIPAPDAGATVARDLDVLLQRRASTLSSHAGQVSFPGGRADEGDDGPVSTALREAEEETGLDPRGVEVLAQLPEIPLAASNHLVTPVLGWWTAPSHVAAVDHAETVEVFRVPVAQLLDPTNRFTSVRTYGDLSFRGPAFDINGTIVWGFTALVLHGIFETAGWNVPWDHSDEREV